MWKAGHNILPTKANLFKRRVVEDPLCPCCKQEEESIIHALWTCPATMDVWGSGPKVFQKTIARGNNFLTIMADCQSKFNVDDMALWAVLARRSWLRRNTLVF
jgi:hypothetical protein